MIVLLVFYIDSILGRFFISGFWTFLLLLLWQKLLDDTVLFLSSEIQGWVQKNKFSTLENSWKIPGILLSSVSEHHVVYTFVLRLEEPSLHSFLYLKATFPSLS